MVKQISVGNVVEILNRHYTCYSPVNYFKSFSINQKEKDAKVISQLESANERIGASLIELYKDLLFYRKGDANVRIIEILNFLKNTFEPLIQKLKDPKFQTVKEMYKEWKLEWMLSYIQDSEFLSDGEFARKYHTSLYSDKEINPDVITLMNKLRNFYFSPNELCGMYKDYVDQNDYLPESEEII